MYRTVEELDLLMVSHKASVQEAIVALDKVGLGIITIIDGEKNIDEMGKDIFEEFISFASGKKTKSEVLDLGRHEFAPWQIGITG